YPDKRGRAEELVRAAPGGPRPLDVTTGDGPLDARLREALFRPSVESLALGQQPATLRFEYASGDVTVEKEFTFPPKGYLVSVRVSAKRGGREMRRSIVWGPGLGTPTAEEKEVSGYQPAHATLLIRGVEPLPTAKLPAEGQRRDGVQWAGVETRYFAAIL